MVMDVLEGNRKVDEIEDEQAIPIKKTPKKRAMTAEETEEEAKMKREMAKIRRLEQKIGMVNKAQQDMLQKMYDHRMKMEAQMNKAKTLEEEKKQATESYDLKNKRGLTSQVSKTAQKKPPIQSGKAIFKSKAQMAAEAEARMFGAGTPSK
jgi:dsDNA-binding SOS-regulon protein